MNYSLGASSLNPAAPQFGAAGANPNPAVVCLNYAGTTVQEALFTNTNNVITLHLPAGVLVGNTEPGEGPAQSIAVAEPLTLTGNQLSFDMTAIDSNLGDINSSIILVNTTLISLQTQITSIQSQITALQNQVATLATAQEFSSLTTLQNQMLVLQAQMLAMQTQMQSQIAWIFAQETDLPTLTSGQVLSPGRPVFTTPALTWATGPLSTYSIVAAAPAFDIPVATHRTGPFTAFAFRPTAPTFGTPGLTTPSFFTATVLRPAAPIFGQPTITRATGPLGTVSLWPAAPVFAIPTFALAKALTSASIQPAAPIFGAMIMSRIMTATALKTASPTLGTTALTKAIPPLSLAPASPVIGTPTFKQNSIMLAVPIYPSAPAFGAQIFTRNVSIPATALKSSAPIFGSSPLAKTITAIAPSPASPLFGSPAIGQKQNITAIPIAAASPAFSSPTVIPEMITASLTPAAPTFDTPTLAKFNSLAALSAAPASPIFAPATFGNVPTLVANSFATASPVLTSAMLENVDILVSIGFATAAPTFIWPQFLPNYILPGTYNFIVPPYAVLFPTVAGAGGGGGGGFIGTTGAAGTGGTGGISFFGSPVPLVATGGRGGGGGSYNTPGITGTNGTTAGGAANNLISNGGYGGNDNNGDKADGGSAGEAGLTYNWFLPGDLAVGSVITVVVGVPGAGGAGVGGGNPGGTGAYGGVTMTITPATQSASLTAAPPVFSAPGLTYATGPFTAAALTVAAPGLPGVALGYVAGLTAAAPPPIAPAFSNPAIGVAVHLVATAVAAGVPAIGSAALGVTANLSAPNFAPSFHPAFSAPVLTALAPLALTATALATAAPLFSATFITSGGAVGFSLTATSLKASSPIFLTTGIYSPSIMASPIWKDFPGAGGFSTGIDIVGSTMVVRTDTNGAYIWNGTKWVQLVTSLSMPPAWVVPNSMGGVFEIRIAPSNPNIFYMAYGQYNSSGIPIGNIFISYNKGSTWTNTNFASNIPQPLPGKPALETFPGNNTYRMNGQKMAIDPNNPNIVYIGTFSNGLWFTTNSGNTWSQVPTSQVPIPSDTSNPIHGIVCIVFDPNSGTTNGATNTIYAAVYGQGVYQTTDAGAHWTQVADTATIPCVTGNTGYQNATITPSGIYLIIGSDFNIYEITNGVSSKLTTTGSSQCIAVDPTNQNHIAAVNSGTLTQTFSGVGTNWSVVNTLNYTASDYPYIKCYLFAGHTFNEIASESGNCAFDPSGNLFISGGFGVWRADAGTLTTVEQTVYWNSQSYGLEQVVPRDICKPPFTGSAVITAQEDLGLCYVSNLDDLTTVIHYPDNFCPANSIDYAAATPEFVAAIISPYYGLGAEVSGYSNDGGQTWTTFPTIPALCNAAGGAIAVSTTENFVWCSTNARPAYYTLDGGASWSQVFLPTNSQILSTVGDGSRVTFNSTLTSQPVAVLLSIRVGINLTFTDIPVSVDGSGNITGIGVSGTINYSTGAISVTFSTAPINNAQVIINYSVMQVYSSWVANAGYTSSNSQLYNMGGVQSVPVSITVGSTVVPLSIDGSGNITGSGVTGTLNPTTLICNLNYSPPLSAGATLQVSLAGTSFANMFFANYLYNHCVAADKVLANTFYLTVGTAIFSSTNGGQSWAMTFSANPVAAYATFNVSLKTAPGQAGHVYFTGGPVSSGVVYSPGNKFMRSIDGGYTWNQVSTLTDINSFGFGAPATTGGYPSIYASGFKSGVFGGVWVSPDGGSVWNLLGTTYPLNSMHLIDCMTGDPDVYGKVYIGLGGGGFACLAPPDLAATAVATGSPTFDTPTINFVVGQHQFNAASLVPSSPIIGSPIYNLGIIQMFAVPFITGSAPRIETPNINYTFDLTKFGFLYY